ncbi:hypothetical protein MyNCGM152_14270 [Achromobacter xylosoxidans]
MLRATLTLGENDRPSEKTRLSEGNEELPPEGIGAHPARLAAAIRLAARRSVGRRAERGRGKIMACGRRSVSVGAAAAIANLAPDVLFLFVTGRGGQPCDGRMIAD